MLFSYTPTPLATCLILSPGAITLIVPSLLFSYYLFSFIHTTGDLPSLVTSYNPSHCLPLLTFLLQHLLFSYNPSSYHQDELHYQRQIIASKGETRRAIGAFSDAMHELGAKQDESRQLKILVDELLAQVYRMIVEIKSVEVRVLKSRVLK